MGKRVGRGVLAAGLTVGLCLGETSAQLMPVSGTTSSALEFCSAALLLQLEQEGQKAEGQKTLAQELASRIVHAELRWRFRRRRMSTEEREESRSLLDQAREDLRKAQESFSRGQELLAAARAAWAAGDCGRAVLLLGQAILEFLNALAELASGQAALERAEDILGLPHDGTYGSPAPAPAMPPAP